MQTLTRLLVRVWGALFLPMRRRNEWVTAARNASCSPNFPDRVSSRFQSRFESPPQIGTSTRRRASCEDSDVTFCGWMYHLN